jgi:hypothetical protein
MLDLIEVVIDRLKNIDIRMAFIVAAIGALCYYEHNEPGYTSRTIHSFVTMYGDLISMFIPLCIATLIFIGTAILILKIVYFIRKLVR